jgi:hypothetical protein
LDCDALSYAAVGGQWCVQVLTALAGRAPTVREQLFADALALGRRGLLESRRMEKLLSGVGYKNVTFEWSAGAVRREHAKELAGKTTMTPQELDHPAELAQQLVTAVG